MSPQPFHPEQVCPRCHTRLVKDMYGDTVHWETATDNCPGISPNPAKKEPSGHDSGPR